MGPRRQIAAENPVRLEAARQAAADGQRKALAYAEGVGASLGGLIGLAEPESATFSRRAGWIAAASGSSGDLPVETGDQDIIATIEVTFASYDEARPEERCPFVARPFHKWNFCPAGLIDFGEWLRTLWVLIGIRCFCCRRRCGIGCLRIIWRGG